MTDMRIVDEIQHLLRLAEDHLRESFPSIREAPAILQHAAGKLFGSTDGYASDLGAFTTRLEHQQRVIGSE